MSELRRNLEVVYLQIACIIRGDAMIKNAKDQLKDHVCRTPGEWLCKNRCRTVRRQKNRRAKWRESQEADT